MIHAFALEPELVATWGNKSDYRYFFDKFGLGTPRIVLEYPRSADWKGRVLKAAEGAGDFELQRITALIGILTERMAKFVPKSPLEATHSWLEQAVLEKISPIIAKDNPRNNPKVIIGSSLGEAEHPQWNLKQGIPVRRSAREMASSIYTLLSASSEIIFVDPHFGIENPRYRRPFEAFLKAIQHGRRTPVQRVIIMTSAKVRFSFFKSECVERIPQIAPRGLQVTCIRLSDAQKPEKLHNRYILTDIGGVQFATGLDDGSEFETDDVTILSRQQYDLRWTQYASDNLAFDIIDDPITVVGIA
ncbi:MAG: hypothetical protein ACOYL3_12455 [Desulfuromonadaceae bacterium]